MSTSRKEIKKEKFSAKEQVSQDFMRMIRILANVKPILEEMVEANENFKEICNSIEFIRQDIKTIQNSKNAILDMAIVEMMDEALNKKKNELEEKESKKAEIHELIEEFNDFLAYSAVCSNFFKDYSTYIKFDDFSKMSVEEFIACILSKAISEDMIKQENYITAKKIICKAYECKKEMEQN